MTKIKHFLFRVLFQTCLVFTVISLAFTLIAVSGDGNSSYGPTLKSQILFLALGFFVSASNLILHIEKWSLLLRLAVHYLCIIASTFLTLFLGAGLQSSFGALLFFFALITVGYLLFAVVFAAVKHRQLTAEQEKYQRQYK